MPDRKFTVRVPASSANLGPGFDCLGMALNLWNELTVEPAGQLTIDIEGEGLNGLPRDENNIIYRAISQFYRKRGQEPPALVLHCKNRIPPCRGLGSSAAATVSGLLAANYLLGRPASKSDILQEAAAIEGHGDNVAPALFGGCQIVFKEGDRFLHRPVPLAAVPDAVLLIPELEIPTERSRSVLPSLIPRPDAVFNLSRVALLVTALMTLRRDSLRWATQDKLHQPQRQTLFPAMEKIFRAALAAGAYGVCLSGSGSTVLAFAGDNGRAIGHAMLRAGVREGLKGRAVVTRPVLKGAYIISR